MSNLKVLQQRIEEELRQIDPDLKLHHLSGDDEAITFEIRKQDRRVARCADQACLTPQIEAKSPRELNAWLRSLISAYQQ